MISGYHVYRYVWKYKIGNTLTCKTEENNAHDKYAVAIIFNEDIVGHVPKEYSKIFNLYKTWRCHKTTVTGPRQNMGLGLEIPLYVQGINTPCVKSSHINKRLR